MAREDELACAVCKQSNADIQNSADKWWRPKTQGKEQQ